MTYEIRKYYDYLLDSTYARTEEIIIIYCTLSVHKPMNLRLFTFCVSVNVSFYKKFCYNHGLNGVFSQNIII